jgi:hypothetical protein
MRAPSRLMSTQFRADAAPGIFTLSAGPGLLRERQASNRGPSGMATLLRSIRPNLGAVSNPALAGADVLYSGALSGRRLSSEREKFPGLVDNAPL